MGTIDLNEQQILALIEAIDWADREISYGVDTTPEGDDIHARWMALRTSLEILLGREVQPMVL